VYQANPSIKTGRTYQDVNLAIQDILALFIIVDCCTWGTSGNFVEPGCDMSGRLRGFGAGGVEVGNGGTGVLGDRDELGASALNDCDGNFA
jgi:hypothetical protein